MNYLSKWLMPVMLVGLWGLSKGSNASEGWNDYGGPSQCLFGGKSFTLIQNYTMNKDGSLTYKLKKMQFDPTGVLFLPESYARPYSNVEKFRLYDEKDKKWNDEKGNPIGVPLKKLDVVLKEMLFNKTETIYIDIECIPAWKKFINAHGAGDLIHDETQ